MKKRYFFLPIVLLIVSVSFLFILNYGQEVADILNIPISNGNDYDNPTYNDVYAGPYESWGIGGGGAMLSFSMSPYDPNLWFVATDMGTLFRSTNAGESWEPISHFEKKVSSDLFRANYVGFNPKPNIVFHAFNARWGTFEKRSTDYGVTWEEISIPLNSGEFIRYWFTDSSQERLMYAASSEGLFRSDNYGVNWTRIDSATGFSTGSFVDPTTSRIYHAVRDRIYVSNDGGSTFTTYHTVTTSIEAFTGGRDDTGLTLAYLDNWPYAELSGIRRTDPVNLSDEHKNSGRVDSCGFVWVSRNNGIFTRTQQYGGDHLCMAENDAKKIYVTGSNYWHYTSEGDCLGTAVWLTTDTGESWEMCFIQADDWNPWPKLETSAVGLDVGYWDGGYESFSVNKRNSNIAGGTGWFFLHITKDTGKTWLSPFTEFADSGPREEGKRWRSTGLEVTSVTCIYIHPTNPNLIYTGLNDIHGIVSEDGGETWRILTTPYNVIYDFAFDPDDDNIVYAAVGRFHDYPHGWVAGSFGDNEVGGGIFKSDDRGRTWTRLTPTSGSQFYQYLSIAYDSDQNILYAGAHGKGVLWSNNDGNTWSWFNNGFYTTNGGFDLVIPQIEIDPISGNVYSLLVGDRPVWNNQNHSGIYFLDVEGGSTEWSLLRGTVHLPSNNIYTENMWYYPSCFAVDYTSNILANGQRSIIWLGDYENAGNWLCTGIWKSTNGGNDWYRKTQYTHPVCLRIDPNNADYIHITGHYEISGTWGNGGALYTTDGGNSWLRNDNIPFEGITSEVAFFKDKPKEIIYGFHGGAMRHGPKP